MSDQPGTEEQLPTLAEPADGLPPVVDTPEALAAAIGALANGTGPVAVDAERAQGFRYSAKAYLVQFRRQGSGTHLVDPIAFENGAERADLSAITEALGDAEWIIHAATQDLPCLGEIGLVPTNLFDTELAGRLLGLPKVGLGPMIERSFGLHLLKEHSAADWSTRPIPDDWLVYAALDVELLVELRDLLAAELVEAGKDEWARQEFAHTLVTCAEPVTPRPDKWRRTSGTHNVRTPRGLAIVRELAIERDAIAQRLDKGPGRIVPDAAITELAALVTAQHPEMPTWQEFKRIPGFKRRQARQYESVWLDALDRVGAMTKADLPPLRLRSEGPPPPRNWDRIKPEAAERWALVRPATVELAEQLDVPVENLIAPDAVRHLAWEPPAEITTESVDAFLEAEGVRPWQRELVTPVVTPLLTQP